MRASILFIALVLYFAPIASADNMEIVYQTIAMESASEPSGQPFVALTIINRARTRGTSLETEAKRPFQYSAWNGGGKWAKAWLRSYYGVKTRQRAVNAYSEALALASKPQYQGIRHYHARGVHPAWAKGRRPLVVLGNHAFYEGIR